MQNTNADIDRDWGIDLTDNSDDGLALSHHGRVPTVANWVEEFKKAHFPKIAPSTQINLDRSLKIFALFIGTRRISKALVVRFCEEESKAKAITAQSLMRIFSVLKQFLRWCEKMDYVKGNFAFLVPTIQVAQKPARMFTPEQYTALKEEVKGSVFYYGVVMAYNTGMRLSDVCLLKWENIDLINMAIAYIPFKTRRRGHRAVCPIETGSDLHEVILDMDKCRSAHPIWSAYVCPGMAMYYPKEGGSLVLFGTTGDTFSRGLKKIGAEDLSFHKLRNSFMSRVVDADVSWPKICQITGLKTFSVLLRYAKPNPDALRKDMEKLSKVDSELAATGVKMLMPPNAEVTSQSPVQ